MANTKKFLANSLAVVIETTTSLDLCPGLQSDSSPRNMKIGGTCVGIGRDPEPMVSIGTKRTNCYPWISWCMYYRPPIPGPCNHWDFEGHRQYTLPQQFFIQAMEISDSRHGYGSSSDLLCVWFSPHHHQREYTLLERSEFCQGPLPVPYVAVRGIRQALEVLYFDQLNSLCLFSLFNTSTVMEKSFSMETCQFLIST